MKNRLRALLCFLLTACLLLGGCTTLPKEETPSKDLALVQEKFDTWTDTLFRKFATEDMLSLHYTLAQPENYGITDYPRTLGTYSKQDQEEMAAYCENAFQSLSSYNKEDLTPAQQITYEILEDYLYVAPDYLDYIYYNEPLGPTTGAQAELPVLLAEYVFYEKEDIEDYLEVLKTVPDYLGSMLTFEQEKSQAGLFMPDYAVEDVIGQCEKFIENPKENYLLELFNEKVEAFSSQLTKEEIKAYQKENASLVQEKVIPAYEALIAGLKELADTGTNPDGLAHFPEGASYYEYLSTSITGSQKTPEEMQEALESLYVDSVKTMRTAMSNNPDVFDLAEKASYPSEDPQEILTYLKEHITEDFPSLGDMNCNVKYVHKSLEEDLSPAFYLTSPIDQNDDQSIYINSKYLDDDIFTTIAHEAYPGHLYQTVFSNESDLSLLRHLISYGGYTEGWGTYSEIYAYSIADLDVDVANLLAANRVATLCVYGLADIGVNYQGWDYEEFLSQLTQYGFESDEESMTSFYHYLVEEPCTYLKYIVGYEEFLELKENAKDLWGKEFTLTKFHSYLLSMGDCPFSVLEDHLKDVTP